MIISPIAGKLGKDFRITQEFGENPSIYEKYRLHGHDAIDFAGSYPGEKIPCVACYDGVVSKVGYNERGYGNYIKIITDKDGEGLRRELTYAHLSKVKVKEGQHVYIGDPVAIIGSTGNSTGVHLHLRMRRLNNEGEIQDYNNNFRGAVNFLPYLLEWKKAF